MQVATHLTKIMIACRVNVPAKMLGNDKGHLDRGRGKGRYCLNGINKCNYRAGDASKRNIRIRIEQL